MNNFNKFWRRSFLSSMKGITITLILSTIFYSCSDNGCDTRHDLGYLELSLSTQRIVDSLLFDVVEFETSNGDLKSFEISKQSDTPPRSNEVIIDQCIHNYNYEVERHIFFYNSISDNSTLFLEYTIKGFSNQSNDIESIIVPLDFLRTAGPEYTIASEFAIDTGFQIDDEVNILQNYKVIDTMINNITYPEVFVLPGYFSNEFLIYSIKDGIIQYEEDNQVWTLKP